MKNCWGQFPSKKEFCRIFACGWTSICAGWPDPSIVLSSLVGGEQGFHFIPFSRVDLQFPLCWQRKLWIESWLSEALITGTDQSWSIRCLSVDHVPDSSIPLVLLRSYVNFLVSTMKVKVLVLWSADYYDSANVLECYSKPNPFNVLLVCTNWTYTHEGMIKIRC